MKGKTHPKLLAAVIPIMVSLAGGSLQAADVFYDFNTDPTGGTGECAPCTTGFIVEGSHAKLGYGSQGGADPNETAGCTPPVIFGGGGSGVWCSGSGMATNGNPATSGYLSIGDAGVNGEATVIVFPDIDSGEAIQAFHLTADLRVGNPVGCGGRPADGFSISYCRAGDPVLVNATNGIAFGAAGGDDCATAGNATGSGDFESGTKTGIAICFDAWFGNFLPDTGVGGSCGPDTEGIEVRADDHTLLQLCLQGDRNGNCNYTNADTGVTACNAAACSDPNTEQTGGEGNDCGEFTNLCWQRLEVIVTNGPAAGTKLVTVNWKGTTLINNYLITNFPNYRGRLVLMGRTGGCNQNDHIANVHLVTTIATVPTYDAVELISPNQFEFFLDDNGSTTVTNVSQVTLDGQDVTALVTTSKSGGITTGTCTLATNLPPNSTHTVVVVFKDSAGDSLGGTGLKFSLPNYLELPASLTVPASSIDLSQNGWRIFPHQTYQENSSGQMYWADEELMGLHGTNEIDPNTVSNLLANGEVAFGGTPQVGPPVINFQVGQTTASQFPAQTMDFSQFGIPSTNDPACSTNDCGHPNITLSFAAYIYFPQPGFYYLGVNSDDGFRVSFAKNSHDLLGTYNPALEANYGRGWAANETIAPIYIRTAGYYGTRLLYNNIDFGPGAVEFYSARTPLSSNTNYPVLINNTNDPAALVAYQVSSAAPPYVSYAEPPLQDGQVSAAQNLHYQLTDASATVVAASVSVSLNGVSQAANTGVNKSGQLTDIIVTNTSVFPVGSNWVQLAFNDSNGANHNYAYSFTVPGVVSGVTLDPSLARPLGSQDLSQPGFMLHVVQVDPCMPSCLFGGPNDCGDGTENSLDGANGMLAGLYFPYFGTNAADLSTAIASNMWFWPDPVAFNATGYGNIDGDTNLPPLPGIPSADGCASRKNDSFSASFDGYAVFSKPGLYRMIIASDDGFRVTEGYGPTRQLLHVTGASGSMDVLAVPSTAETVGGNWQGHLPTNVITAPIVYVNTNGCPCQGITNDLTGVIALIDGNRCNGDGSDGNYADLVGECQERGAIACIVQASPGWGTPERMGGGPQTITIPALHILGFNGLKDWFHTNGPLTATIGDDTSVRLGQVDAGKGASDVSFAFNVPQAGVYPLHMIYEQGGGGAALAWFNVVGNNTKVLVNDVSDPSTVMFYRGTFSQVTPQLRLHQFGSKSVLEFAGVLRSSPTVNGTYSPVMNALTGQPATSPYVVPTGAAGAQFYRTSKN